MDAVSDTPTADPAAAKRRLQAALQAAQAQGRQDLAAECHRRLSALHERIDDLAGALHHHRRYHDLHVAVLHAQAATRAQVRAIQVDAERARPANDLLDRDANKDSLTGLGDRRFFEQAIQRVAAQAAAKPRIVLALADIDLFKQVNDRFSHAVGDRVLRQVAELFKQHCRQHDLIARYGGEEFVVAFVNTLPGEACEAAERLRRAIARFEWASIHPDLRLTISIGLAPCLSATGIEAALRAADSALYAAKREGRNRVHLRGGSEAQMNRWCSDPTGA